MSYSIDLRERVVDYVRSGGSQMEAGRLFKVTRRTVYNWLHRENLAPATHGLRRRKIDKQLLAAHIRDYPDALLRERAEVFGVDISCISRALKRLRITKKNDALCGDKSQ